MASIAVQPSESHPDTSTIFVLGVLGLVAFIPFGLCAWLFGDRLLAKYDAEPGRWSHRRVVEVGRLLGIVGLGVLAAEVLLAALVLAL